MIVELLRKAATMEIEQNVLYGIDCTAKVRSCQQGTVCSRKRGRYMLNRINDFLAGLPMTIVGGVFLVMSFVFSGTGIELPIDPAWVTVIICGIPLLYLSVRRVIYNKGISKISSALLISIAMIAAIAIGDLFAAGEVAFIMEIGAILEDMTTSRAKKGLQKLINLAPTKGRRIFADKEELIGADKIRQSDILRVLAGETIPVDGIVISGETSVDQSIMTGESLPVDKTVGDEVFCGTVNRFGVFDMKATKVGEDSSLQKLIRMVQDAESKQAPMQRIADKCANWLVPVAMLIAIVTGLATQDIVRAVTVLVVFCPCALVLATPTAIMAAIGQATKYGVIIKSGEALEKMGRVNTIAFDKTGTLTYGKPKVSNIISFDKYISEHDLLALSSSAEVKSEHPLGKAVVAYAKEQGIEMKEPAAFQMESGKGIYAEVSGMRLYCGNERFIRQNGVTISANVTDELEKMREQGKVSVIIADNNSCIGLLALSDVLRPDVKSMIDRLSDMGIVTVLLTGDNQKTAEYFAMQQLEAFEKEVPEREVVSRRISKTVSDGELVLKADYVFREDIAQQEEILLDAKTQ